MTTAQNIRFVGDCNTVPDQWEAIAAKIREQAPSDGPVRFAIEEAAEHIERAIAMQRQKMDEAIRAAFTR